MAVILVSNCLLGCTCRYKGDDCKNEQILALAKEHTIIGVCPEQMGGLSTPRDPAETSQSQPPPKQRPSQSRNLRHGRK